MFFKNLCVLTLWTKVASALEPAGGTSVYRVVHEYARYQNLKIPLKFLAKKHPRLRKKLTFSSKKTPLLLS